MKRMRLPGWVVVVCAVAGAVIGCGDGSLSSPDAGTGIVLTTPPPFSIPTAPAASALRLCDANVGWPSAIGFLSDGRIAVGAQVDRGGLGATLVSAWDPRSNSVEPLFLSPVSLPTSRPDAPSLVVSKDGRRIFELRDQPQYRVYDVEAGALLADAPITARVTAIAGDGLVVLDSNLLSLGADGTPLVDFSQFVPADGGVIAGPYRVHAMSFDGSAIAVGGHNTTNAPATIVIYADGRVVPLPDSPGYAGVDDGAVALDWSKDGRHLLQSSTDGLRIWDLTTGELIARSDESLLRAAFVSDADRVLTADDSGVVIERDLSLAPLFRTAVSVGAVFGPDGKILGSDASGFRVLQHGDVLGYWPRGGGGWPGAVALRDADSFMLWSDPGDVTSTGHPFGVELDRYESGKAGAAATFRADTAQSEWRGDLALAPDESRLAAVLPDLIAVLDAATLAPLARIETSAGTVAWSPDGHYLAATPDLHYRDSGRATFHPAPEVTVWDAATGKLAHRFVAPAFATKVAFDKTGARLAGSGYPSVQVKMGSADGSPPPSPITIVTPSGDPLSFEIDLVSGAVSATAVGRFVGATRELVATPNSIVAISTGASIAGIPSPAIGSGVFSGDFSMLLAVDDLEAKGTTDTHLISVADGHTVASLVTIWGGYGPSLALSRNGRRVQLDYEIYCLDDRP